MKITKQVARDVAEKLTKELDNKNKKAKEATLDKLEKYICETLCPSVIMDVFKSDHKHFLQTTNYIRLHGNGFNYETVYLNNYIPSLRNTTIELPSEMSKAIRKEIDANKVETRRINQLTDDVEKTILNFRTYKNLQANFKEAADLLPQPKTNLPIKIDLNNIRKQLKQN